MRVGLAAVAALLLVPASSSDAAPRVVGTADFGPPEHADGRDVPGDPLDLRAVTFGQRDTRLVLKVRTHTSWNASSLRADSLCLSVRRSAGAAASRVCVDSRDGRAVLTHERVTSRGAGPVRSLNVPVTRDSRRGLVARFSARSIGLPRGGLRWSIQSRWIGGGTCADGCIDRVPDRGEYAARASVLAQPRCFGAAARGGSRPCRNPSLARTLIPTPDQALRDVGAPCQPIGPATLTRPCEFGDRSGDPAPDVLLVGDSHTNNWRGAVDVVAHARGWRGVSMTRPGCALSTEVYPSPPPEPEQCRRRNAEVVSWLAAHPSVHTVFTAASAGRGLSPGGFHAMFGRLPPSVRTIYVIRDVPRVRFDTPDCVTRVHRKRRPTTRICAVSRAGAMPADAAFSAAARSGQRRVRAVDLTRHFCDRARCYPVVGGAYVYIDDNHMNTVFSTTLGPFLLRRVE